MQKGEDWKKAENLMWQRKKESVSCSILHERNFQHFYSNSGTVHMNISFNNLNYIFRKFILVLNIHFFGKVFHKELSFE